MKVHYVREQEIYRFKTGERVNTTEQDARVETDLELEALVRSVMLAANCDHYELKSVHLYFKKANKRRSKQQEVHIYKW